MITDKKVTERLREAIGGDPELLNLLLRLTSLVDIMAGNIKLGDIEAPIQELMENVGGSTQSRVIALLPDVLLVKAIRYLDDKNGLRVDSGMTQKCRAASNAAQSVASGVPTLVAFNVSVFDTDDMHDPVVNNSRITFKTAGTYLIGGSFDLDINATGDRVIQIVVNGASQPTFAVKAPVLSTGSLSTSTLIDANRNDFAELLAFQDSGSPLNIINFGTRSPSFWAHRLS